MKKSSKKVAIFPRLATLRASSSQSDLRAAGSDKIISSILPKMTDLQALVDNELHIGQRTSSWNPKMAPYLHSSIHGVHVFDLEKTAAGLENAKKFMAAQKIQNKRVLFVGTKPQTALVMQELLGDGKQFFVDQKWMPGLLTNFKEIRGRIDFYLSLKSQFESGEINKYTKKEVSQYKKELDKLDTLYHGVGEMRVKPDVIVVLDAVVNRLAIEEAATLNIPVVAVVDSNANPDGIAFPIPANDDSIKAIRFLLKNLVESLA